MPTQPRDARRLGATLTLMGVVTVNVLATLLLPGLSTDATATTKQVSPAPVRIVGAPDPKFLDSVGGREGCADQTWPYIESRCLTRTTTAAAPLMVSTRSAPSAPAQSPQTAPPVTPKIEIDPPTPARASTWPSDPQPLLKDGPNNSVGPATVAKAHVPDTSSYTHMPPAPGSLVPRTPREMPALQLTEEARMALVAATVAAGLATTRLTAEPPKVRTRSERRRRTTHSSRSFRLFGFRVGGLRF